MTGFTQHETKATDHGWFTTPIPSICKMSELESTSTVLDYQLRRADL